MDVEFVHLHFFRIFLGKSIKYHCSYRTNRFRKSHATDFFSLRENLVNIRNSNLTELYSDSITELFKKCNISLAISCKQRKPKQLDEFIVLASTGQRPTTSSSSDIHINIFYPILEYLINELDNRFSNESGHFLWHFSSLFRRAHLFIYRRFERLCGRLLTQSSWFITWNSSCKEVYNWNNLTHQNFL